MLFVVFVDKVGNGVKQAKIAGGSKVLRIMRKKKNLKP